MGRESRGREDIIASMLLLLSKSPVTSTYFMMYKVNIGYLQFRHYFELLQSRKLISRIDNKGWSITERGREYLAAYEQLMQVMEGDRDKGTRGL